MVCKTITQFVAQQCDTFFFVFVMFCVFVQKTNKQSLFILVDFFSIFKNVVT